MAKESGEFSFRFPVEIRFRDIDIAGHAHHAQALVYFEEARAAYWRDVVGRRGLDDVDYIMAEVRVRYHQRVRWPGRVSVGVRVSRLGKRHFEMEYAVEDDGGELLVSGDTVQVMYDYEAAASKPIPPDVRERIEALEGAFGPGGRPVEAGDA